VVRSAVVRRAVARPPWLSLHRIAAAALAALLLAGCTGPILPARSKPGGAAKWGEAIAYGKALAWSRDAVLVRINGAGVGIEGWLPDRGGEWQFTYSSADRGLRYEVVVDSDGKVRHNERSAITLAPLPRDWIDSPRIWNAARAHWSAEPVHTIDAELASGLAPNRAPGQVVWRLRFWMQNGVTETHWVAAAGQWIATE
jgi:hypothetical protein